MGPAAVSKPGRVLVLGDYRQTITVVRSLGRAGFEVTLGTAQARSSTGLSRHVADVWVYDNSSPQRYCNHLEAFLRNERPDFVCTVGESQLRPLIEAAPRLEPLSTWLNPGFETVARCFDKPAMYQLASTLGIASVHGSAAESEANGLRHDCHVAAADGKLIAYFHQEMPSLRVHCEALVKALRYTGVGCIQFLVDERSGSPAFLEFNARMDGFPLLAMRLAVYRKARSAERFLSPPDPVICADTPGFDWRDPLPTLHAWWCKLLNHPLCRRLPIAQPSA
jgi:hypothetical protein